MLLSVRVLVTAIERKLGQQSQDSGRAAALVFVGGGSEIRSSCLHSRHLLTQHLHSPLS